MLDAARIERRATLRDFAAVPADFVLLRCVRYFETYGAGTLQHVGNLVAAALASRQTGNDDALQRWRLLEQHLADGKPFVFPSSGSACLPMRAAPSDKEETALLG